MTETTPRSESSPAGRLIPNADKMRFKNKLVVEAPRPDTAYADDLGAGVPVKAKTSSAATVTKKGWSP